MSPQSPRIRTTLIARFLPIPYAIALALIVWLPASEASKATGIVFASARWVSDLTGVDEGTTSTVFEFLANIALFVPLGVLISFAWPRLRPWMVALLGFAVSVTIELVQVLLLAGFRRCQMSSRTRLARSSGVCQMWASETGSGNNVVNSRRRVSKTGSLAIASPESVTADGARLETLSWKPKAGTTTVDNDHARHTKEPE